MRHSGHKYMGGLAKPKTKFQTIMALKAPLWLQKVTEAATSALFMGLVQFLLRRIGGTAAIDLLKCSSCGSAW